MLIKRTIVSHSLSVHGERLRSRKDRQRMRGESMTKEERTEERNGLRKEESRRGKLV